LRVDGAKDGASPVLPPMIFSVRVGVPDRPGMLGRLATAFGKGDVNILTLDVVDRDGGVAIDDLRVEAPRGMQEALRQAALDVPGFAVEYVRPLEAFRHVLEPLELAALLAGGGPALPILVEHLPDAFGASWAMAVDTAQACPEVLAASLGAPSGPRLPLAWLDFSDLLPPAGPPPHAGDQPLEMRQRRTDAGLEVAAALLGGPTTAVLLGREHGPRFRASEGVHLRLLARIAAAAHARSGALLGVS
jgi:hypothetical protein